MAKQNRAQDSRGSAGLFEPSLASLTEMMCLLMIVKVIKNFFHPARIHVIANPLSISARRLALDYPAYAMRNNSRKDLKMVSYAMIRTPSRPESTSGTAYLLSTLFKRPGGGNVPWHIAIKPLVGGKSLKHIASTRLVGGHTFRHNAIQPLHGGQILWPIAMSRQQRLFHYHHGSTRGRAN